MEAEKAGKLISFLRKERGLTQKQLAEMLSISDKAVSRWERGRGYPDISLLPALSKILQANIEALLQGNLESNQSAVGNLKKAYYCVCPICGSVSVVAGHSSVSCCGRTIVPALPQKPDKDHTLSLEQVEDQWFITAEHPMTKEHYISWIALAGSEQLLFIKQYPEWDLQVRLPRRQHGTLLWYCSEHGLFYKNI